jgi:hypothetical protein
MRFIRFLTVYFIVAGGAVLLAPESMGKLSRWFGPLRPAPALTEPHSNLRDKRRACRIGERKETPGYMTTG